MSNDDLIEARRDYTANTLSRSELSNSPFDQFTYWLEQARKAKILDATAMALATASSSGQPHVRIVLLKKVSEAGFSWYTNQQSDKGQELQENPQASLLFYWRELERQVRIEGQVTRLDPKDADEYFYSRPEGSRFSAAISKQSAPVASRDEMKLRVDASHKQYPDGQVPRPEHWGGYQLIPSRFEFWQGRSDRLHDRFIYTQASTEVSSPWAIQRLEP